MQFAGTLHKLWKLGRVYQSSSRSGKHSHQVCLSIRSLITGPIKVNEHPHGTYGYTVSDTVNLFYGHPDGYRMYSLPHRLFSHNVLLFTYLWIITYDSYRQYGCANDLSHRQTLIRWSALRWLESSSVTGTHLGTCNRFVINETPNCRFIN